MTNATDNTSAAAIHCAVGPNARRSRYRPFLDRVGCPLGGVVRFGDVAWDIGADGTTPPLPRRSRQQAAQLPDDSSRKIRREIIGREMIGREMIG